MFDKKKLLIFSCCFLILLCFAYSVHIRREWFLKPLHDGYVYEWQTAHSVCVTNNWLKEGAFNLRFMHVLNPASIEFDTFSSRKPYISYPPGTFIPVFLLAKTFGIKDLIMLYQSYNLLNHFVISIILFLLMFMIIDHFQNVNILSIFFSIIPSLIYLFTPLTLYFHQNSFFADQAVMMLFSIFIYLEMKRFLYGQLNWQNKLIFTTTVFLGTLTDWLFVFVVFVAVGMRIIFADRRLWFRQSMMSVRDIVIPALSAIAIFIYQIASTENFLQLAKIFKRRLRSGPDGTVENFLLQHFNAFAVTGYGHTLCLFAVLATFALLFYYIYIRIKLKCVHGNKIVESYIYLICLTTLPCLFQVYLFQQHSVTQAFSALKYALPLSLIPFGIFPIVFITILKTNKHHKLFTGIFCVFCIMFLAGGVFYWTAVQYKSFFLRGSNGRAKRIGELVKRNASYNDICFSFDFEIPQFPFPPQRLAYSEKRVYKIKHIAEAEDMVSKFAGKGAIGKIFIKKERWSSLEENVRRVCSKIYEDSDYYICQIEPNIKEGITEK